MSSSGLVLHPDTPWIVPSEPDAAVAKALEDLESDWHRVFGLRPLAQTTATGPEQSPLWIGTKDNLPERFDVTAPESKEAFRVTTTDATGTSHLVAVGSDTRGTIYAIYAISEWLLEVDPMHHWTGHSPTKRDQIAVPGDFDRTEGPPTFRYRGWFVNDEDILHQTAPDPLEETVLSIDTWDRIYETILRLRGNMVVPGTFTFPDETCRDLAAKRGLVLSDHHVCPLGLVTFDWPADTAYSWWENPDRMREYWEDCVKAQCDREMVWTVSYRGTNDRAFWEDDPDAPDTDAERAAVIREVIEEQVAIVERYDDDPEIVCTMFDELTDYYREGLLELPEGVVPVWDDDGAGTLADAGQATRGEGAYYHLAHGLTNRASEVVHPETITSEIGRLTEAGATEYFLCNVSNVGYLSMGIPTVMQCLWDGDEIVEDPTTVAADRLQVWCSREYGSECAGNVADLYDRFLRAPHHNTVDAESYPDLVAWRQYQGLNPVLPDWILLNMLRRLCCETRRLLDDVEHAPEHLSIDEHDRVMFDDYRTDEDPVDATLGALDELEAVLASGEPLQETVTAIRETRPTVPDSRQAFFDAHLLAPAAYLLELTDALETLATGYRSLAEEGDRTDLTTPVDEALDHVEEGLAVRHQAEQGPARGWLEGDVKSGCWHTRDHLRCLRAVLDDEPEPAVRPFQGAADFWAAMYAYHDRGRENYPRFYDQPRWE